MPIQSRPAFLVPLVPDRRRRWYRVLAVLWLLATLFFWQWWLRPAHNIDALRYWSVTALLAWAFFLQAYFVFITMRGVRSSAPDPVPGQWRVAMIVTKTPAEPFAVLRRTLEAMLAQDYPHDTWLADEDPDDATRAWCAANGVRISCRKGVADYHRPTWPRRTRCKEGNLAYFYDSWGYADYDIVAQLDADHVPQPGYLREMLRPFADPGVGYVTAPSVNAANRDASWAARTRLDTEGPFHGPLQAGYSNGLAPMCIGSHYAVRTSALQAVGGLGPELAEDHSTTMILNAGGWRGVHAIDARAVGDGPASVSDLATQEFQWSRSLVTLLLRYTPRYLRALPGRLRAQFLFCQLLYPFIALTLLAMYLLPIYAVLTDQRYANVTFPGFLLHAVPAGIVLLLLAWRMRRDGLLRPNDARILGWEKILFVLLQWPWVLAGCVMAVRDRLTGGFVDFRITPKGAAAEHRLPWRVLGVYVVLALGAILPVILVDRLEEARGFWLLSLFTGLLYLVTVTVIVLRHLATAGWAEILRQPVSTVAQIAVILGLSSLFWVAITARGMESLYALNIGLEPLQIVRRIHTVSGAGMGSEGGFVYILDIRWQ